MTHPDKMPFEAFQNEDENEVAVATEKIKEEIKTANPERFQILEQFYAIRIAKKYHLLSEKLREQYDELDEDWFNISDKCDRWGEDAYRKFVTLAEEFILRRESDVVLIKNKLHEITKNRLLLYVKMLSERGILEPREMSRVVNSDEFSFLDSATYEVVEVLLQEIDKIDVNEIDEWEKQRTIENEKREKVRLRAEKARILGAYQKMSGKSLDTMILLCQKLGMVESVPRNNLFLSQLSGEELLTLESKFRLLEKKLHDYGLGLYEASNDDIESVLSEIV